MDNCIPATLLPLGYNGKILLLSINADGIDETIILRCGDLWHSEILRATENEIKGYGLKFPIIDELGGAWVKFDYEGNILIFGTSEEYGSCDKNCAADLLRQLYPDRLVRIEP